MGDINFLYSELSQAIVAGVKVAVSPREKLLLASARQVNPEAYDLFMKGYNVFWIERLALGVESYKRAMDYWERAIKLDPNFAPTYTCLGHAYWQLGMGGDMPEQEVYPKAKAAIMRALELDENLAPAHSDMAWITMNLDWDFPGAEKEFKRALELEPGNINVQYDYNVFLRLIGRFDEAIKRQKQLEKTTPPGFQKLAEIYICAGRYDEGLEKAKKSAKKDPNNNNNSILAMAYETKEMYPEALELTDKILSTPGWQNDLFTLAESTRILALSGKREDALKTMDKLRSSTAQKNIDPSIQMAMIYEALGDRDRVFESLNKAYEKHPGTILPLKTLPAFHSLHGDPRFKDLLKKIGFD
jgi:adenylate cyclase